MMLDSPHTSAPMLMRGNTPPTMRSPTYRSPSRRITTQPTTATVGEEERGGRGTTSRRTSTRAAPEHRPPPTARHAPPPPRTSTTHPPSDKTQSTAYTSTNDPHCRKPAHSRRRASTGGHPRLAATARGRPPGDARRQPRVSPQQWQATRRSANSELRPGTGGSAPAQDHRAAPRGRRRAEEVRQARQHPRWLHPLPAHTVLPSHPAAIFERQCAARTKTPSSCTSTKRPPEKGHQRRLQNIKPTRPGLGRHAAARVPRRRWFQSHPQHRQPARGVVRTNATVRTQHGITASVGQRRGDVEIRNYLRDQAGSRSLVFDLSVTHERFGSSSHPQQNELLTLRRTPMRLYVLLPSARSIIIRNSTLTIRTLLFSPS